MDGGTSSPSVREPTREALEEMIRQQRITPHFQPVFDLLSGEVLAYEVLSRGEEPFRMPTVMFTKAEAWGLLNELDQACRVAALKKIAALDPTMAHLQFFLNVDPQVFNDNRYNTGLTASDLDGRFGLDQGRLIVDVSEEGTESHHGQFERMMHYYLDRGFRTALTNFGAGRSSLVTLVTMTPHYIKIDRSLVLNIEHDSRKQQIVKAMTYLAASVDCTLMAMGVETAGALEVLIRLGVRYAQGFLLAGPESEPHRKSTKVENIVGELARHFSYPRMGTSQSIVDLLARPETVEVGSLTCEELEKRLRHHRGMGHLVVLRAGRFVGLITREHFNLEAAGRYGFQLIRNRFVEEIAKRQVLSVHSDMDLVSLARLAMDRPRSELYDPVVVTDYDGRFLGTITMKQLLNRSVELEVKLATDANPLTSLPGNVCIQNWLQEVLKNPPFTVVYADLDRFKEYNDCFGFSRGDEMIKHAAKCLQALASMLGPTARLGHVGGDDFILVAGDRIRASMLEETCARFDREKLRLFDRKTIERGYYRARDRQGSEVDVPLVTISLAVINHRNVGENPHPGEFGQIAAALKKKIKAITAREGRSGFLSDRRKSEEFRQNGRLQTGCIAQGRD